MQVKTLKDALQNVYDYDDIRVNGKRVKIGVSEVKSLDNCNDSYINLTVEEE